MQDTKLHDEQGRLAALHRYEVLDTAREASFERITQLVQTVLQVPISTVSLIDADRQWYKSCAGMPSTVLPRQHTFCTHTIQSREPLVIPDTLADPRFAEYPTVIGEPFIRSYVGVPLSSPDGYNLGALCALDRQPRDFTIVQIELLKSFANLVVDELELRRIAQTDALTGSATRRAFLLEMEKALSKYRRHKTPAALLMLDIDHFKRVNDTYGHPTGDAVLKEVSRCLAAELRNEDLLGRLGGEEFGVLLNHTNPRDVVANAERLRRAIQALSFQASEQFKVTASFGISVSGSSPNAEDWLADADAALYEAKRAGRNRCTVAQSSVEELAAVA